jgi:hypothetical protein
MEQLGSIILELQITFALAPGSAFWENKTASCRLLGWNKAGGLSVRLDDRHIHWFTVRSP